MPPPVESVVVESPAARRIRHRLTSRFFAVGLLAVTLIPLARIAREAIASLDTLIDLLVLTAVLAPVAAVAVKARDRWRGLRPARVVVSRTELKIETPARTHTVPIASIESGWFVSGRVEIAVKGGDRITIAMSNAEATAVRRACRLGATQRRQVVSLCSWPGTQSRAFVMCLVTALPLARVVNGFVDVRYATPLGTVLWLSIWLVLQTLVALATAKWLGAPRVVIGTDGVRVEDMLSRRFVPHADIVGIAVSSRSDGPATEGTVILQLRNGSSFTLPSDGAPLEEINDLVRRIEGSRFSTRSPVPASAMATLSRNGRSMKNWRRDLASQLGGADSYRKPLVTRDDLLGVLDDSGAATDDRLTAAVALSVLGGDENVQRIRVAAGAMASEHVRVALDGLARPDPDDSVMDKVIGSKTSAAP